MSMKTEVHNISHVRVGARGENPRAVKFAAINVDAAQTDASLVAAVVGKKIRVLSLHLLVGADATVLLESGGSTALTGVVPLTAAAQEWANLEPEHGVCETAAGEALTVTNVGVGGTLDGVLSYVEV